jgi:hypothetical protein
LDRRAQSGRGPAPHQPGRPAAASPQLLPARAGLTGSELQIATNGGVTAAVVDPQTGETVGGFSGMQTLPLKVFRAIPGGSVRIPLLIGTASSRARLGYTVPPGEWGIRVTLRLGPDPRNSLQRRTPILPLTITA